VEVGDQQVGLRGSVVVCAFWGRHCGCVVFLFCGEEVSPSGGRAATIGERQRSVDIGTGQSVAEQKRRPKTKKAAFGKVSDAREGRDSVFVVWRGRDAN
jgi:hypothetical protein